jgi:hypothetical protein
VWMPFQVVLSLFIATGGLMLLLILGFLLGPFVGSFMLVRYLVRGLVARASGAGGVADEQSLEAQSSRNRESGIS